MKINSINIKDTKSVMVCSLRKNGKTKKFVQKRCLVECPDCKKERWVLETNLKKVKSLNCLSCAAKRNIKIANSKPSKWGKDCGRWKGGSINGNGYRIMCLHKKSPFFAMASRGRIREHRLVMAKHLKRPLEEWEIVHHINGKKLDNRIENLELLPGPTTHTVITMMDIYINKLKTKVAELEKENYELKNRGKTNASD